MPRKRIDRLISKVVTMNGDEKNFYLTPSGDDLIIGVGQESDINDTSTRILTVNSTSGSLSGSFTGSFSGSLIQATRADISEAGGMVIGHTDIYNEPGQPAISLVAPTDALPVVYKPEFSVDFICPSNGAVDIEIQIPGIIMTTGVLLISLSSTGDEATTAGFTAWPPNSTIPSAPWALCFVGLTGTGDNNVFQSTAKIFIDNGLTPGQAATVYVAFSASGYGSFSAGTVDINYGNVTNPLRIRALTVPTTRVRKQLT
jgi:hypothetical protein